MYQVIDQIMDWIMLTKIRNYVWRAKIRSAWHNRVKAPLEVFFGPKPLWLDHRSKKRGLKNKTRKLFTKEKSFKKEVGVKKLTCVQWKFGMLHKKPKESLHDKMECRPIFCPKTPCSHFCCVQKKKTPSGACTPLCHTDFILGSHAKFLISVDMIQSIIRPMIWSVMQSVIHSVI